jgi:hypothetical protein
VRVRGGGLDRGGWNVIPATWIGRDVARVDAHLDVVERSLAVGKRVWGYGGKWTGHWSLLVVEVDIKGERVKEEAEGVGEVEREEGRREPKGEREMSVNIHTMADGRVDSP